MEPGQNPLNRSDLRFSRSNRRLPVFDQFFLIFDFFRKPNQIKYQFAVEPTGPIRFLKPWALGFLFYQALFSAFLSLSFVFNKSDNPDVHQGKVRTQRVKSHPFNENEHDDFLRQLRCLVTCVFKMQILKSQFFKNVLFETANPNGPLI